MLVASRDFAEEIFARIRSRVKEDPMLSSSSRFRQFLPVQKRGK
jgi:hypothetical protein